VAGRHAAAVEQLAARAGRFAASRRPGRGIGVSDSGGQKLAYVYYEKNLDGDLRPSCRGGLRPTCRSCRAFAEAFKNRPLLRGVMVVSVTLKANSNGNLYYDE
jgi:hypothetical protein